MDLSETIVVYDFKLATDDQSNKKFRWHQNFVPWELYAPCPGAIYMCIKSWKKCIKSDFKEIFLNL